MGTDNSVSSVAFNAKIQQTLISINELTLKIKKEIQVINQLAEDNGQLRSVISNTNEVLSKIGQKLGIDISEGSQYPEGAGDAESSILRPITALTIMEKLSPYMNDQEKI